MTSYTTNVLTTRVVIRFFIYPTGRIRVCKIRFVSTGENRGKPCLVCKKTQSIVLGNYRVMHMRQPCHWTRLRHATKYSINYAHNLNKQHTNSDPATPMRWRIRRHECCHVIQWRRQVSQWHGSHTFNDLTCALMKIVQNISRTFVYTYEPTVIQHYSMDHSNRLDYWNCRIR